MAKHILQGSGEEKAQRSHSSGATFQRCQRWCLLVHAKDQMEKKSKVIKGGLSRPKERDLDEETRANSFCLLVSISSAL